MGPDVAVFREFRVAVCSQDGCWTGVGSGVWCLVFGDRGLVFWVLGVRSHLDLLADFHKLVRLDVALFRHLWSRVRGLGFRV